MVRKRVVEMRALPISAMCWRQRSALSYLDGGLDIIWSRLEPWFAQKADAILDAESYVDAKSRFQEWAQAELGQHLPIR